MFFKKINNIFAENCIIFYSLLIFNLIRTNCLPLGENFPKLGIFNFLFFFITIELLLEIF